MIRSGAQIECAWEGGRGVVIQGSETIDNNSITEGGKKKKKPWLVQASLTPVPHTQTTRGATLAGQAFPGNNSRAPLEITSGHGHAGQQRARQRFPRNAGLAAVVQKGRFKPPHQPTRRQATPAAANRSSKQMAGPAAGTGPGKQRPPRRRRASPKHIFRH